jgi:hypothetical protein
MTVKDTKITKDTRKRAVQVSAYMIIVLGFEFITGRTIMDSWDRIVRLKKIYKAAFYAKN